MDGTQTQLFERRATFAPTSLDEAERTFEVIASTGADVRRNGYIERLDLAGAELTDGTVVLDSHCQDGLDRVLGVVEWRREAGKLIAKVRLSERRAAWLLSDIKSGIIKGSSLGYSVQSWTDSRGADGVTVRTATRWRVHELSLVPVPADAGATVRMKGNDMPDTTTAAPEVENRAQINAEIRSIAKLAGLTREWADGLIDRAATADEARAAAFEQMATQPRITTTRATVGWSSDDPQVRYRPLADAVFSNVTGTKPGDQAQPFLHCRGIHDVAREALAMSGLRTTTLSAADLIARSMSTSDFPIALGSVVGRFVRAGYDLPRGGVLELAQERLVPDFKEVQFIAIHGPGRLQRKYEGGEVTYSYLDDKYEVASVTTFAKGLIFTREAMINDDRGAFSTIPTRLGIAARDEEALQIVDLLNLNTKTGPTLKDGVVLFHATHGNINGTPAAPDEAHLSAARLAMRKQTDSTGRRVGVEPSVVLVPADLETSVQKLLGTVQPNTTSAVNPFSTMQLLVESRLTTTTRYYTVARNVEGLILARLEGRAGPQVETEVDFDTKSIKFSVLNDFVPAFIDYRGWYADGVGTT